MKQIVRTQAFWFFLATGLLGFFAVFLPSLYGGFQEAEGATYTVCASDCDHTTITSALAASTVGDTITVGATYASSTETFPLTFPTSSITLNCEDSGAVIGVGSGDSQVSLLLAHANTVRECAFSNVRITNGTPGDESILITENSFATTSPSWIYLGEVDNSTISNNTGVNAIKVSNSDAINILSNTIYFYDDSSSLAIYVVGNIATSSDYADASKVGDRVNIDGNTIYDYRSNASSGLITMNGGTDNTINDNTIDAVTSPTGDFIAIMSTNVTDLIMTSNKVDVQGLSDGVCQSVLRVAAEDMAASANVRNNTVKLDSNCVGLDFYDGVFAWESDSAAVNDLTINATYNIIYNSSVTATGTAMQVSKSGSASTVSITSGYNGFYNMNTVTNTMGFASSSVSLSLAATSLLTDPFFKDEDVDTTNDWDLRPYSPYLDVFGTTDIGASAAARGSSFTVDDDGTIDYSSVDATSTTAVVSSLRASDTVTLKAGTYEGFAVSTTASGITIKGASGEAAIVNGTANAHALSLTNLASPIVDNLTLQNASSSATTYAATSMIFDYGGNTYDDTDAIGMPAANLTAVITSGASCQSSAWAADDADVTTVVGDATNDFHLALVDIGGAKVTFLVPDNYVSTAAAVEALCSGYGASVDAWVTSTFAVSDGVFTYDSSAISAAGITLTSGYTSPPTLTRTITKYAGLYLNNVSSATVTNVTSTDNQYGFYFSGTTASATITTSTATSSLAYDIYSDGTGDNTIQNLTYNTASSSIASTGNVSAAYTARWLIQNASSTPVVGISVFISSADSSVTSSLVSVVGGYTPFTSWLTAYTLTNASPNDTTAGGYNSYTALTTATTTYNATSLLTAITEPQQEITLTLSEGAVVPTAVTDLAIALSSGRLRVTWTDNASGNSQEDYYVVDYVVSSSTDDFPGTVVTTTQDAEIYSILNASPNAAYLIRVAGVNSMGTSTYVTSSITYSYAVPPSSVAVSASGQTAAAVSWNANSNPSGTVYEVYDVTNSTSTATTTDTSYVATGLTADTTYEYKVRAQYIASSTQWGSYSDSASTTLPSNDATSVTLTLTKGESAGFSLAGTSHTALYSSLSGSTASLTVSSTPVTFSVAQGASVTIDTDGNGADDMQVTADSVAATVGVFTLSLYTPSGGGGSSGGGVTALPHILGVLINDALDPVVNTSNILVTPIAVRRASEVLISVSADMSNPTVFPWNGGSLSYSLPTSAGVYTIYVQGRGKNGKVSNVVSSKVTLDYARTLSIPTISSPSDGEKITALPFVVSGTAEPGAEVSVRIAGSVYTVTADEAGIYETSILDQLSPRSYQLSVEQSLDTGEKSLRRVIAIVYQPPGSPPVTKQSTLFGVSDPSDISSALFAQETFLPEKGGITEAGVEDVITDVQEKSAFLLVLQNSSAQFYKTQTEEIIALPGESIELLLRPGSSPKSVTARLYPDDGLAFQQNEKHISQSWLERMFAMVFPTVYAQEYTAPSWVEGYLFEKNIDAGMYKGNIVLPEGQNIIYTLVVSINEDDGSRTRITKHIRIPASGTVTSDQDSKHISYAQIDIYKQDETTGVFSLWDGDLYGQINPLFANKEGQYAVSVPPGRYYVNAHASGHDQYTSDIIIFERADILAQDISLTSHTLSWWERFWKWIGLRLGGTN